MRWTARTWRRCARTALVAVGGVLLLITAGTNLILHLGPTRQAEFRGKRVAHSALSPGPTYRVSYTYDADGLRPSDTDGVSYPFYLAARWGTPLRVRTFGFGTFRFARLAGASDPAADRAEAARWTALTAATGAAVFLWSCRRRRQGRVAARVAGDTAGAS